MTWAQAFARQAASDLRAYDVLADDASLPACHRLHHLQMACEKLCKSSMIAAGTDPIAVQQSHAHIAKHLPRIVAQYMGRSAGRVPRRNWVVDAVRPLARRIELLNPAVQNGGSVPENCEYPWPAPDGSITAPADHPFAFDLLFEKAGVTLLKVMRQAAVDLQR